MKTQILVALAFAVLGALMFVILFLFQPERASVIANELPTLHAAAVSYPEKIDQIIAAGSDVDALDDENGVTPLLLATMTQKHESVKILLANGANPNVAIKNQDSPLTTAAHWGNLNTVRLLVDRGADVNGRFMSRSALHQAIIFGHDRIFALLIEHPDIDIHHREYGTGYTPLHLAVQYERHQYISKLIAMGADSRIEDAAGNTPLDLAAHKTDATLAECFYARNENGALQ